MSSAQSAPFQTWTQKSKPFCCWSCMIGLSRQAENFKTRVNWKQNQIVQSLSRFNIAWESGMNIMTPTLINLVLKYFEFFGVIITLRRQVPESLWWEVFWALPRATTLIAAFSSLQGTVSVLSCWRSVNMIIHILISLDDNIFAIIRWDEWVIRMITLSMLSSTSLLGHFQRCKKRQMCFSLSNSVLNSGLCTQTGTGAPSTLVSGLHYQQCAIRTLDRVVVLL